MKKAVSINSKHKKILWVLFSVVLSVVIMLGKQIVFCGSVNGRPAENYIKPFGPESILNFVIAFFAVNLINVCMVGINRLYTKRFQDESLKVKDDVKHTALFAILSFAFIFIMWLPYRLAYFPGGLHVDTIANIERVYMMDTFGMHALNNHHPILYILLWRACFVTCRSMGVDLNGAIVLFTWVQFIFMAGVMTALLCWLKRHGLSRAWLIGILYFIAYFPLFPLYAISLWKDTPFSLFLLIFTMLLGDWVLDGEEILKDTGFLVKFVSFSLLVCFMRNNGKYVVFAVFLILLLVNRKKLASLKKLILSIVSVVLVTQVIQGPVYNAMDYNVDSTVESLGVPLQQIAYLVYYDYDLTEEELEYIGEICPIPSMKEYFKPCIVDDLKWYAPGFDVSVIENDKVRFLSTYLKLMLKHPVGGIKAYMMATSGFWAPNVASPDGYVQYFVWPNVYSIEGYDYLQEWFGFTIRLTEDTIKPISSAVFFFCMIFTAFFVVSKKNYRYLFLLLPGFLEWGTIMVATPTACSLRYVYILVLLIPIEFYLICTCKDLK